MNKRKSYTNTKVTCSKQATRQLSYLLTYLTNMNQLNTIYYFHFVNKIH